MSDLLCKVCGQPHTPTEYDEGVCPDCWAAASDQIYVEVAMERAAQDRQWGGPEHDDAHRERDWEDILHKHAYRLVDCLGEASPDYRQRLIKIAALAVAAIQAHDRQKEISDVQEEA